MTSQQEQLFLQFKEDFDAKASFSLSLSGFLQYSEYQLIVFMVQQNVWQGPVPPPPSGFTPNSGSIELGLFLYWFNNPQDITDSTIRNYAIIIADLMRLPASLITLPNYNFLCTNELIYTDGTVLSTEQYATYDQGWFAAFINLVITDVKSLWYNNGNFPAPAPGVININGTNPTAVRIALVGDWGAGNTTAQNVMNKITGLNPAPDYIIHLGDVYYGGTPAAGDPGSNVYPASALNEEMNNLVNAWPVAYNGKSFTLNSNHEMYSGAIGLFCDALNKAGSPFSAQRQSGCFALQYADWTILGLDSAFYGTSLDAFMQGFIGDASSVQYQWIKSINPDPAKTIVLTHHTGCSLDGSEVYPLWYQLRSALGGDPYAWYWGHAHNGIVYKRPMSMPATGIPVLTTNTYARCAGHGSLPYGIASSIVGVPNVLWQADTAMPSPSQQSYNGFVLITLSTYNGAVRMIDEEFYDTGTAGATWSNTIFNG